jgi:hypothetical protein
VCVRARSPTAFAGVRTQAVPGRTARVLVHDLGSSLSEQENPARPAVAPAWRYVLYGRE